MRITFIFALLFVQIISAQTVNKYHSTENIKIFADHLFCEEDYLRAMIEYGRLTGLPNDTIQIKLALSSLRIEDNNALNYLNRVKRNSAFYYEAEMEKLVLFFKQNKLNLIEERLAEDFPKPFIINALKLYNISYLFNEGFPIPEERFLVPFDKTEKEIVKRFYSFKTDPPYKSPLTAGILSAIIPGAGKIYTKNYGDGITAFIATTLFAYLSYTNFENDHDFRGWLFAGVGGLFYAGNIYGSVASAKIFNAKINFEFKEGLKLFLEERNYYSPEYNFCD